FVPLNWRLASKELDYILSNSSPKLLVIASQFESLILNKDSRKCIIIHSEEYCQITGTSNISFETHSTINENDPLAIIYTGGTTGKPKGVVLTHQSMMWNGLNTILSWNLTAEDVTLTYMPMFHTGGLNAISRSEEHTSELQSRE